jgi:hypothetical protein
MQADEFFTLFIRVVPESEQQDEPQRRLVVLLNDGSQETTPEGRSAMAAAVRRVAREAVDREMSG